jgi:predicted DNA-binding protein YlxM (UPF0122 family)
MNEYLNIKEFSKEVGLSRQAIYQRLEKDLKPFVKVENKVRYIKSAALTLFGDNSINQMDCFTTTETPKNDMSEVLINSLLNQLETKDRQLETKDIQLSEKDKQISDLTTALLNEQHSAQQAHALHAGTIHQKSIEETVNKRGLFLRWFKK